MRYLGLNEIREMFLKFFETKEHLRLPSHSLVPENDKSLLLINSGMAPLKPFFTGAQTPPSKRVTTCQKCIRTGDIENVGQTARHGTFFEMLGDFSFGDYFKEEIIPWSWEFCTETLGIPAEKLFVSIFYEDDEAFNIWTKIVPENKIFRMGRDDNFWEVGLGPCGPCSEIYYDRGEKYGCGKPECTVGCDCDRYMEFWNLVFTQFDKQPDGSYPRLAKPNIDTGMGLERMAVIMQDVYSLFDVDTVKAIRDKVCEIAGVEYGKEHKKDVSIRVITDHARAVTFLTGDGVRPENEGRGYVLRRLLRRAVRHGRLLGIERPFFAELCEVAIEQSKDAYPELDKRDYILQVVSHEEKRFMNTLGTGLEMLNACVAKLKSEGKSSLDSETAFRLYDTYGFPFDLTKEILEESGITCDEEAFRGLLDEQRERARNAREESNYMGREATVYEKLDAGLNTEYAGYDSLTVENAEILAVTRGGDVVSNANEGDEISVFVNKTPFYAESGGQVGDAGRITAPAFEIEVTDCIKTFAGKIAHIGIVKSGSVTVGDKCALEVDAPRRAAVTRGHTATHLLHQALRDVLGSHVEQSGSYVAPGRLRFDFAHFSPLTDDERERVEQIVNDKVLDCLPVNISVTTMDEARKMGAMALFGEKYGEEVRVVKIADYSMELCGGCHVGNTAGIGSFKILSENGVSAGVRRIEALTGSAALAHYKETEKTLHAVAHALKTQPENVPAKVASLLSEMKELARAAESMKSKMSGGAAEELLSAKKEINGVSVVLGKTDMDGGSLRSFGDTLKEKLGDGVVVLAGIKDGNAALLVMATDSAVKRGVHAGNVISQIAPLVDGRGGGKPAMAQAGGKNPAGADSALKKAEEVIAGQIG